MPKQKTCRYDSSLGLLTKKFVALIQGAPEGVLDLNQAATALGVQKRRIYDITNVLEGIGLIEKRSKNNIQWKGMGVTGTMNTQQDLQALKDQVKVTTSHERWLDHAIAQMQQMLQGLADDHRCSHQAFVTHDDVRTISAFAADTVIAIKAPSGTTLEVPDPDEGMEYPQRRYQVYLKSTSGPVEVFLVSPADQTDGDAPRPQWTGIDSLDTNACDPTQDANNGRRKRSREGGIMRSSASQSQARVSPIRCGEPSLKLIPVHTAYDLWADQAMVGVNDLFELQGVADRE